MAVTGGTKASSAVPAPHTCPATAPGSVDGVTEDLIDPPARLAPDQPAPAARHGFSPLSRRGLLQLAGAGTAALAAPALLPGVQPASAAPAAAGARFAPASPALWRRPGRTGAPPVEGLHLTFGEDTAREMVATWATFEPVSSPRVMLGTPRHGFGGTVPADTRAYTDGASNRTVYVHSARMTRLRPDTTYLYAALHDGADAEVAGFRTAPAGRAPFVFTSFGDMASPGVTAPSQGSSQWVNDALGSANSLDVLDGIERVAPLFNLINGDLCYANLSADRLRVWQTWLATASRSARLRPWMPAAGNHENEKGNGPIGYDAFRAYFPVPGTDPAAGSLAGLWYAFTVGNVRFVVVQNDDICLQDGGSTYVRGYSGGGQREWLDQELARTRADRSIDWIVVCMHQVAISTADHFNGADLGIRETWLPLFDRYGVDLVVCGHEHHYERSHPVRGTLGNATLTPRPGGTRTDVVDSALGTVHMVIGGGGTSVPSNTLLTPDRRCRVITEVSATPDPATGKRAPVYVWEDAVWSANRDASHPYGFASFAVDPGHGGTTSIEVTYHAIGGAGGAMSDFDSFTLTKQRHA